MPKTSPPHQSSLVEQPIRVLQAFAFRKFVACDPSINKRTDFVLCPIKISLPHLSKTEIFNLLKGNYFSNVRESLRKRVSVNASVQSSSTGTLNLDPKVNVAVLGPKVVKKRKTKPAKPKPTMPGLIKIKRGPKPKPKPGASTAGRASMTGYKARPLSKQKQQLQLNRPHPQSALNGMEQGQIQLKQEPVEMTVPVNPDSLLMYAGTEYSSSNNTLSDEISGTDPVNLNENGSDGYVCPVCDENFILEEDLLIHRRSHRFSYACPLCPQRFDTASELNAHNKTHYNTKNFRPGSSHLGKVVLGERVLKKRGLPLTKSPFLSFNTSAAPASPYYFQELTPLTLAELTNPNHACETCGESFVDSESLKDHYLSHFGLVPSQKGRASKAQAEALAQFHAEAQAQAQSYAHTHGPSQAEPAEPFMLDRSLVPYGRPSSGFELPPTPSPSSTQSNQEITSYQATLIQAERIKKFAFASNDSVLLNKMLDVESHVAGKIMAARAQHVSQAMPNYASP